MILAFWGRSVSDLRRPEVSENTTHRAAHRFPFPSTKGASRVSVSLRALAAAAQASMVAPTAHTCKCVWMEWKDGRKVYT